MHYRSWLLVPGNNGAELGESIASTADVIVVDLAGIANTADIDDARANAIQWLSAHRRQIVESKPVGRWVRINPPGSRQWRDDLHAVMPSAPDGLILPRSAGPEDVRQLAAEVYELEQRHNISAGATRIIPVVGESPEAALTIGSYMDAPHQRLAGLAWDSAMLARTIGARRLRLGRTARWSDTFARVRTHALMVANACGILAIDAPHDGVSDEKIWRTAHREARADGFAGGFVRDASRVGVVNEAFAVSDAEMELARAIVAAFANEPDAGNVEVDRRMISRPQLKRARRMLGLDEISSHAPIRQPILRPA